MVQIRFMVTSVQVNFQLCLENGYKFEKKGIEFM